MKILKSIGSGLLVLLVVVCVLGVLLLCAAVVFEPRMPISTKAPALLVLLLGTQVITHEMLK